MITQVDLDELEERLNEKIALLPTKEEFFSKMDEVMGELQAIREEHTISQGKTENYGDRIENLERIHPHGKHAST